jgi:hypothetical protein
VTRDEHLQRIYITASQKRGKQHGLVLLCSGPECHGAEMFAPGLTVGHVLVVANQHIDDVGPADDDQPSG